MKKNIKEAELLVKAYRSLVVDAVASINITNAMVKNPSQFTDIKKVRIATLKEKTGFGSTSTCILCKPVSKEIINDETFLACNECVWGWEGYREDNVTPCYNKNYENLCGETTEQEFVDLLKERISMLEDRIKIAEEENIAEDIASLELKEFVEKLNKSRKKHGTAHFHSLHEALGVCHEELHEATIEIHANNTEEAANELLDLAVAAFWGYKSFKKREK